MTEAITKAAEDDVQQDLFWDLLDPDHDPLHALETAIEGAEREPWKAVPEPVNSANMADVEDAFHFDESESMVTDDGALATHTDQPVGNLNPLWAYLAQPMPSLTEVPRNPHQNSVFMTAPEHLAGRIADIINDDEGENVVVIAENHIDPGQGRAYLMVPRHLEETVRGIKKGLESVDSTYASKGGDKSNAAMTQKSPMPGHGRHHQEDPFDFVVPPIVGHLVPEPEAATQRPTPSKAATISSLPIPVDEGRRDRSKERFTGIERVPVRLAERVAAIVDGKEGAKLVHTSECHEDPGVVTLIVPPHLADRALGIMDGLESMDPIGATAGGNVAPVMFHIPAELQSVPADDGRSATLSAFKGSSHCTPPVCDSCGNPQPANHEDPWAFVHEAPRLSRFRQPRAKKCHHADDDSMRPSSCESARSTQGADSPTVKTTTHHILDGRSTTTTVHHEPICSTTTTAASNTCNTPAPIYDPTTYRMNESWQNPAYEQYHSIWNPAAYPPGQYQYYYHQQPDYHEGNARPPGTGHHLRHQSALAQHQSAIAHYQSALDLAARNLAAAKALHASAVHEAASPETYAPAVPSYGMTYAQLYDLGPAQQGTREGDNAATERTDEGQGPDKGKAPAEDDAPNTTAYGTRSPDDDAKPADGDISVFETFAHPDPSSQPRLRKRPSGS